MVIVVAVRGIHTFVEGAQETGDGVLETICMAVKGAGISAYYYQLRGASPILVIGPEHAAEISKSGYDRESVKQYLFDNVRIPLYELKDRGHWGARGWPEEWEQQGEEFGIPMALDPDRYIVVVAGGDGRHSSWLLPWSATQRAVEIIET